MQDSLPVGCGIGWRAPHYQALLDKRPPLAFIEIHPENHLCGGIHRARLEQAAALYPLSFHCVGLSLGSAEGVNLTHLEEVAALIEAVPCAVISDHLSWSKSGNAHLNDLLPLPYTAQTLDAVAGNISRVQDRLKHRLLVENPSTYLSFFDSNMSEAEFLVRLFERTGCGLLLDVNNVYVQAYNHGFDPKAYIDEIPAGAVGEIHLAGHTIRNFEGGDLLIDTHNRPVGQEVWELYSYTLQRMGAKPTLIEWDADFPTFETLLAQVSMAEEKFHAAE